MCDNIGEHALDEILTEMLKKFDLGKNYGIRVLVQQPLSNYVQILSSDDYGYFMSSYLNNKNQWTKFDFLIEYRQNHAPLLAIELDGPIHRGESPEDRKQQERDKYKDGACDALGIPILRIQYEDSLKITAEEIQEHYQAEILSKIFNSLFKEKITTPEKTLLKYKENDEKKENYEYIKNIIQQAAEQI